MDRRKSRLVLTATVYQAETFLASPAQLLLRDPLILPVVCVAAGILTGHYLGFSMRESLWPALAFALFAVLSRSKAPRKTFLDMHIGLVIFAWQRGLPLTGDGKDIAFDFKIDGGRIKARRESIYFQRLISAANIDRWKRAPAQATDRWGKIESLLQLALQGIQFGKYVARK